MGAQSLSVEGNFIVRGSLHLDFSTLSHMIHAHHRHHGEYDNEGGGLEGDHISKLGSLAIEIAIAGGKGLLFVYCNVCFHAWFWLFEVLLKFCVELLPLNINV